nr:MAG TPA: hypothetical protein [Bacteriophage sp.]
MAQGEPSVRIRVGSSYRQERETLVNNLLRS